MAYVYVCQDWFPLTGDSKDEREQAGFQMEELLKMQIDYLINNATQDWNFTIVIGGQGEMRVGKSVLELQIMAYWTYEMLKRYQIKLPFNVKQNLVFNGEDLIPKGMALGQAFKYAAMGYDEAADDLESGKAMRATTQAIKDYLRKAAQFNMLNVIVQAEFFELPKSIALSRSIYYIDVYYVPNEKGIFKRGYFNFFSKRQKKYLYLYGKKELNYQAVKPDFYGHFPNFYPLDEAEYRREKELTLETWNTTRGKTDRKSVVLKGAFQLLRNKGMSYVSIAEEISKISTEKISQMYVSRLLNGDIPADFNEEKPTVYSTSTFNTSNDNTLKGKEVGGLLVER